MKRRITIEFVITVLISILLFIVGAFFIVRNNMNEITELNLNKYLEIMKIEYEVDSDETRIVDKYADVEDYIRITFIDLDGEVLEDSLADTEGLENHSDRPEINNLGDAYIRFSSTLEIEMMYIAHQFEDGVYLRVAIPTSSLLPFLNDFIGLSIVIAMIIVLVTILMSSTLVNHAMKPLFEVEGILADIYQGKYTRILPIKKQKEINQLINKINDINKMIAQNISSLKSETEKSNFLLNQMNQGICVLDKEGSIVMINQYLRRLYRFNIDININKDYRFLFREENIQGFIKKAYKKHVNTNAVIAIKQEFYSVSISFLEKNWLNQPGVIIVFNDITAIKNMEMLKKELFDNASHELKSPLTSIIGSSELIIQGMAKDEKTILDLNQRIYTEAQRMNNLVMDMLTLSKYENQEKINHQEEIDLNNVVHDVVKSLKRPIDQKQIQLTIESQEMFVKASYDDMYQLVKNLTENAVKYGKEEGLLKLIIKQKDNDIIIKVIDDGIGIPKEDQSRIFERFFRVDKARSQSTGGTGLGLSIVKHIVLNYDGYIELDSAINRGTKITVHIPKKALV